MGTFSVSIEAVDPQALRFTVVEALVDTGATCTTLPTTTLHELGVTPHTRRRFVMANGEAVVMEMGRTLVRIDGRQEITLLRTAGATLWKHIMRAIEHAGHTTRGMFECSLGAAIPAI